MSNQEKVLETNKTAALETRMQELEAHVPTLNESVQRALQDLLPKVESLISSREEDTTASGTSGTGDSCAPTSLLEAVESGNVDSVLRLLHAGANVLQRNKHGENALHLAAALGNEGAVACLVGYVDVNGVGPKLRTALHRAAGTGHVGCVRHLLSSGAKGDLKDGEGFTPLMLAAQGGDSCCSVVELLAEKGVSLNATDRDGNTAMVHAAKANAWNVVKLLCKRGASAGIYKNEDHSPLVIASEKGQEDVVNHLLRDAQGITPENKEAALYRAKGAEVLWAFEDSNPGTLQGDDEELPLLVFAEEGELQSMIALLDAGVSANSKNKDNGTAVYFSSAMGHTECLKVLLEREALPNEEYKNGDTALHIASENGHEECVKLLLDRGADANMEDQNGKTPLDLAKTEQIKQLLTGRCN